MLLSGGCRTVEEIDLQEGWARFKEQEEVDRHFRLPKDAEILRGRRGDEQEVGKLDFGPLNFATRTVGAFVEIDFALPDTKTPVAWLYEIAGNSGVNDPKVRYLSRSSRNWVIVDGPKSPVPIHDVYDTLDVRTGPMADDVWDRSLRHYRADSRRTDDRQPAFYRCRWINRVPADR